ncbi:MAG: hypothetical protein KDD92_13770 [Caldilineaceae bacterium]|nr:hypothetical protein [Caldilineaceae bacterium]
MSISRHESTPESIPDAAQLRRYLDFAAHIAREAGARSANHFRKVDARRKGDGTLVTIADEEADRFISREIRAAFPDHAVLSEEQTTLYDPNVEFTWVVDPIDGTTNFARGMSIWGVSIGLLQAGRPLVGVLHMPMLGETYSGAMGLGAACNGIALTSASETEPTDQHLLVQCTRTLQELRLETPLKSRMLGSAAYHMTKVAEGSALAGLEATPKVWDIAAVAVIMAEAGALLTLRDGSPGFPLPAEALDYVDRSMPTLAAANPAMQAYMLGLLRTA